MATQWMPQNIQKRLLLYLLSQLSLFSGIDLQNINDVTLGSNSTIELNDVELDPDALQIPGVYIRSGNVVSLKLELSMNGSVVVTCDGVKITLSLANGGNLEASLNAGLEKSKFNLQQSTMDLANSLLHADDDAEEDKGEENPQDMEYKEQDDQEKDKPQSALNSVMSKAVEAALSRLQVNCSNISARLILDHATLDCIINETTLAVVDGVRKFNVSDIMVVGIKPHADPGQEEPQIDHQSDEESHHDDVETSTDDDDDRYNEMMSSSVLRNPTDLNESLIYSKQEASSIYMSATSDVLKLKAESMSNAPRLISIDEINVSFTGLTELENLKIDVGRVNIALTPIPLTVLHVVESLISLHSKPLLSRNPNSRLRRGIPIVAKTNDNTTSDNVNPLNSIFEHITISDINLNFTSSILPNGSFARPDDLTLSLRYLEANFAKPGIIYGFLKEVSLAQNDEVVGGFEKISIQPDIKFEYKINDKDFTLLLTKNLTINLDYIVLNKILKLAGYLDQLSASLHKLNSSRLNVNAANSKKPQFIIQTSIITLDLKLAEENATSLKISPISYSSELRLVDIKKISLFNNDSDLLSLFDLQIRFAKEKQVRTFDNNGREVSVLASTFGKIESIEIQHGLKELKSLGESFKLFGSLLEIPTVETVFKPRKKTRISNSLLFQTRQSVKLFLEIGKVSTGVREISEKFGDLGGELEFVTLLLNKDNVMQIHSLKANLQRVKDCTTESVFIPVNVYDKKIPVISIRTKDFKRIDVLLRNVIIEYYTNWLAIFDASPPQNPPSETSSQKKSSPSESNLEINFNLVEIAIGLNPGRLPSKAVIIVGNGSIDVVINDQISIKSQLRQSNLVLIDDIKNITHYEEAERKSWTTLSYYQTLSFADIAQLKTVQITGDIVKGSCNLTVAIDKLEVELCADSSQCLISVLNDLKLPVSIDPELKYKIGRSVDLDAFEGVDENAFNENTILKNDPSVVDSGSNNDGMNIVEEFYVDNNNLELNNGLEESLSPIHTHSTGSSILTIRDSATTLNNLERTQYFNDKSNPAKVTPSEESLLFEDDHFISQQQGQTATETTNHQATSNYPFILRLNAEIVAIKIFDGYDWKHTRRVINKAVKRLKDLLYEKREMLNVTSLSDNIPRSPSSATRPPPQSRNGAHDEVIGETLFDSIHVSFPVSKDPNQIDQIIHDNINASSPTDLKDEGIEVGKKSNLKKLRLRRSKQHKLLIEIEDLCTLFILYSTKDPLTSSQVSQIDDEECEVLNELKVTVANFEITDNVPTSTWNKFVTYMKDIEREYDASMLTFNMKTVRPISTLAATELILAVKVLPLRLHVDQDTLEMLTRFGEFKDSRFFLIDEFEDIPYIQKFEINAVQVRLDYKPKKIDYAGLRSGHTTEFMNFFILDEADMILKQATLYGVSGFPKLGLLLNGLWMPDIKFTQLSGVLAGLAPVRSVVNIGSNLKDLILVPVKEYKKDGRLYRSVSKGVELFTKNTTNELLKFGVKLAAGTQALLENTEQALGGSGSSARVVNSIRLEEDVRKITNNRVEDDDEYYENTKFGHASQLIGKSSLSNSQANRSIYQPTLESIADINQTDKFTKKTDHHLNDSDSDIEQDVSSSSDDELPKAISLYANQPSSLMEGLQLAYDSLGRNFLVVKKAIVQAGIDINESNSAQDAGLIIAKTAPIALIRPIIGATEATSKALLGINNQFDPEQWRFVDDKYKQIKK